MIFLRCFLTEKQIRARQDGDFCILLIPKSRDSKFFVQRYNQSPVGLRGLETSTWMQGVLLSHPCLDWRATVSASSHTSHLSSQSLLLPTRALGKKGAVGDPSFTLLGSHVCTCLCSPWASKNYIGLLVLLLLFRQQ